MNLKGWIVNREHIGKPCFSRDERRKGRDLFDLSHAVNGGGVNNDAVLRCWYRYMTYGGKAAPSSSEFLENMEEKMATEDYCADVALLLRPGVPFDSKVAYVKIKQLFISRIDSLRV